MKYGGWTAAGLSGHFRFFELVTIIITLIATAQYNIGPQFIFMYFVLLDKNTHTR